MSQVDFLPVAIGAEAQVDSQATFAGSGYQQNGFALGIALQGQMNKIVRQSSVMTAALANVIANVLQVNVLDDGNLANLINLLTELVTPPAGLTIAQVDAATLTQATPAPGDNSTKVANTAFVAAAVAAAVAAINAANPPTTMSIVTGQRTQGTVYQNTSGHRMTVSASLALTGGVGQGYDIYGNVGPTGSVSTVATNSVTNSAGQAGVTFVVPPGYFYSVTFVSEGGGAPFVSYWTEWIN